MMKNFDIRKMKPKKFTHQQLCQISDENHGVLNRCIDMTNLKNDVDYVSIPRLIHHHGYGKPVEAHLRTLIIHPNTSEPLAYQDMTFEQWARGIEK